MVRTKNKKGFVGFLISLGRGVILITITLLVILIIVNDPLRLTESSFISYYSRALMSKNISRVQNLSSTEVWDEMREWIIDSEIGQVKTSFRDDCSESTICSFYDKNNPAKCSYWINCRAIDYQFFLFDVTFVRSGIKWKVISIGSICESLDYSCSY